MELEGGDLWRLWRLWRLWHFISGSIDSVLGKTVETWGLLGIEIPGSKVLGTPLEIRVGGGLSLFEIAVLFIARFLTTDQAEILTRVWHGKAELGFVSFWGTGEVCTSFFDQLLVDDEAIFQKKKEEQVLVDGLARHHGKLPHFL